MSYDEKKKFLINFALVIVILGIVYVGVKYVLPVVLPFVTALLLAALLDKPICFLEKRWKVSRGIGSILVVTTFFVTIGLICTFFLSKLFYLGRNIWMQMPQWYESSVQPVAVEFLERIEAWFAALDPGLAETIDQALTSMTEGISAVIPSAFGWVSGVAVSVPQTLINCLVAIILTYFISVEYRAMRAFILRQIPTRIQMILSEIKNYLWGSLVRIIFSYLILLCITFTELTIGLGILRIENAVLIALGIAIFDILPVLGTGGILIPWAVIEFVVGDYKRMVGLIILYLVVVIIRNIIEPKIVGQQVGLSPVVMLGSMLIGLKFLGAIGFFGFPITLAIIKDLNDKKIIQWFH